MNKVINAELFGLSKRVQLEQRNTHSITIKKEIKSRIIMKDGLKIVEMAKAIREKDNSLEVSLKISGPICSKTIKLLEENDIELIQQ